MVKNHKLCALNKLIYLKKKRKNYLSSIHGVTNFTFQDCAIKGNTFNLFSFLGEKKVLD